MQKMSHGLVTSSWRPKTAVCYILTQIYRGILIFGLVGPWDKIKKTSKAFFEILKNDIFRAFFHLLVIFFLFTFVLATGHSIRPTALIFGIQAQCDIERGEKTVFFGNFHFSRLEGNFHFFKLKKINFRSLNITVLDI